MNEPRTAIISSEQEEAAVAERTPDREPVREQVCDFEAIRPELLAELEDPF
jgi:hypothetical protein